MKTLAFVSLIFASFYLFSQENVNENNNVQKGFFIGAEFGGGSVTGKLIDSWPIRQDVSSNNVYYSETESDNVVATSSSNVFGRINVGYTFNRYFEVISGVKFSQIYADIRPKKEEGFFYIRYKNDGTGSEFARLDGIVQDQYFISIPLEVKFNAFKYEGLSFYVKLGTNIGLNVATKNDFEFALESMNPYKDEIMGVFDMKTNSIISTANASIGLSYWFNNDARINFDFNVVNDFITKKNSSILDLNRNNEFSVSCQIPFNVIFK